MIVKSLTVVSNVAMSVLSLYVFAACLMISCLKKNILMLKYANKLIMMN